MTTQSICRVRRETSALVRDRGMRPVIVTVIGAVIELRPKGLRKAEVLDLGWCYYQAVKQRVMADRTERQRIRKSSGRRKERRHA
ncbi:MAG: hypothetical protein ABI589_14640 [Burkholderiales bacterium]